MWYDLRNWRLQKGSKDKIASTADVKLAIRIQLRVYFLKRFYSVRMVGNIVLLSCRKESKNGTTALSERKSKIAR